MIVIAPTEEITQHTPIGLTLLDQVFTEAGMKGKVSEEITHAEELRRTLIYLSRRYPKRVKALWIEPLSLRGLYVKFRYRLKSYPSVLIKIGEELRVLTAEEIIRLPDIVAESLSRSG